MTRPGDQFWPEDTEPASPFGDVFTDLALTWPADGMLRDRYGLVTFSGFLGSTFWLPNVGTMGDRLLQAADPQEYDRVFTLWHRYTQARGTISLWLDLDGEGPTSLAAEELAKEEMALAELGLPVEEARQVLGRGEILSPASNRMGPRDSGGPVDLRGQGAVAEECRCPTTGIRPSPGHRVSATTPRHVA